MIEIISQTNLDVVLFISDLASASQVTALNLGLIRKGFICNGIDHIIPSTRLINRQFHQGIQVRFTKMSNNKFSRYITKSFFRRSVKNENNENLKLIISNIYRGNSAITINIELTPADDTSTALGEQFLKKFTNHVVINEDMKKVPEISVSSIIIENANDNLEKSIESAICRVKIFEENYRKLYPLLMMRKIGGVSGNHTMTFAEFERFEKYSSIIKDCSFPTNIARKKFIELCEIFRLNTILKNIRINNLELVRENNCLGIKLFGIALVHERTLKHFLYFDHPNINFIADFVDKTNMFNNLEAKISREIFIRI